MQKSDGTACYDHSSLPRIAASLERFCFHVGFCAGRDVQTVNVDLYTNTLKRPMHTTHVGCLREPTLIRLGIVTQRKYSILPARFDVLEDTHMQVTVGDMCL